MKFLFALVLGHIPSLTCVLIAGYLAINGLSGWGWFIFGAVLLMGRVTVSEDDEKQDRPGVGKSV